ncbi:MAG: hypothetical protein ABR520_08420, partial [Mycobacteriales bacterium]
DQPAPAGAHGDDEKTVAPAGPGATSEANLDTERQAAREAGEYAASFADVDPAAAAPIARDDKAALADPDAASSEPVGSAPKDPQPGDFETGSG